jgi:hypothetical protein
MKLPAVSFQQLLPARNRLFTLESVDCSVTQRQRKIMQDIDLRKVLCWIFAGNCLLYVVISLRGIYATSQHHMVLNSGTLFTLSLFELIVATISGVSWWMILKEKPSARGWGLAASVVYILIFLEPIVFSLRSAWPQHFGALVIGIAGMVVFLRRDERTGPESGLNTWR